MSEQKLLAFLQRIRDNTPSFFERLIVDLLVAMTDDVAHLVLEDNRLQALALSIAECGGAAAMPAWSRLIDVLEESGDLDRKTEGLASAEDLARRAAARTASACSARVRLPPR